MGVPGMLLFHEEDSLEDYTADNERDSDDSDSDSFEEIQIKRYLNRDFGSAIKQAKALQNTHVGLKKQIGHYQLRDIKHAVLNTKDNGYHGHHWDVKVNTGLERSTPRLTSNAINREVDIEQRRRTRAEKQTLKEALKFMADLNDEYKLNIVFSQKKVEYEVMAEKQKIGFFKDEVQVELQRKKSVMTINTESEEERKRQIKLLLALKGDAQKTASITDLVDGMAETNHKRIVLQQDLNEAFFRLMDDQEDLNFEYRKALTELLDESMINMSLMLDRDKNKELALEEQLRRVKAQHNLIQDKLKWESLSNFDSCLFDLNTVFKEVQNIEEEQEKSYHEKIAELKTQVQEELLRRVARKWIEKATATEKARRIKEQSEETTKKDPLKESMKTVVMRLQRQMILQKFDGKWKNEALKLPREDNPKKHQDESDMDRKLRQMRTRNRRMSCVERGMDDD